MLGPEGLKRYIVHDSLATHLPPRQIVELILAIGSYVMLGRMVTALDLDLDESLGEDVVRGAQRRSPRGRDRPRQRHGDRPDGRC